MKPRRHAVLVTVFVALSTSLLAAQQPPGSDPVLLLRADEQQRTRWATEWLRSGDQRQVAWGAWLARQDHQTALIPVLIEKVEQYQPTNESQSTEGERHDALLVVLDALIDLGARVPVQAARKLYPEFAAQSLILLIHSQADAQSALLDIFQNARANWNWLAAGKVLVKTRPAGFASLLVSRFTQHITVSVFDPGVGGGIGGGGSECGFSLRAPKEGWPPVGLYLLTQFPERMPRLSATLLIGGDTAVYYWRTEPGNYDNPPDAPGACDDGNRDRYRAQYLARLMDPTFPRISPDAYPQVYIEWRSETDYRQRLLAAVEEQRAEFRRVLAALQDPGRALNPAEAAILKPRLEVVIRDGRTDRSIPLPEVLKDDGIVAVRTAFTQPLY
jgi:hypothetical protein